jgi:hypothetical protein
MNVLEENKTHQLPLSTLSVRWQLKPTLPGYNSSYLHQLYLRTIGLRISPYQKLSKLRGENLAPLFCNFLS